MEKEHLLELQIIQPGGVTGRYIPETGDAWRLEAVVPPTEALPFDVAELPSAWTLFDEPFRAIVLSAISHPPRTWLECRLLGAFQRGEEPPFLIASPTADPAAPTEWQAVPPPRREAVLSALANARPGEWRWLEPEAVAPHLHEGARRYRSRAGQTHRRRHAPAWQALRKHVSGGYADAEQYTAAEYTFFDLPFRFQQYVGDALAPDERILYAARRPAMPSQRNRSWLRRERLQEGVLLLTTHRLIHLAELIPPDAANIRYGFREIIGVLERLRAAELRPLGEHLALVTRWETASGLVEMVWESPYYSRTALKELLALLAPIVKSAQQGGLRRATPPPLPETLRPLVDTASNDPNESQRLTEAFRPHLEAALQPDEQAYAWAMLPQWFQPKQGAQVLVSTNQRVFLLPQRTPEAPLQEIGLMEFTSSIVDSHMAFTVLRGGQPEQITVRFPYPAKPAFRACFEYAWRCAAVLPL